MKKYIVLSVNDNQDYLYYTPLTCWAWRKFGWEPIVLYRGEMIDPVAALAFNKASINDTNGYQLAKFEGYRSDTITQMSRLYAACVHDGYLMTGDVDMIPLSDYWNPNENEITVWGYDLTGYTHYPICYIGMTSEKWADVMSLRNHDGKINNDYNSLIKRDLDTLPQAKSDDFYKFWFCDQDLITKRLLPFKPTIINRGQYPNGYARGRVDRGAWSLNHSEFIDCHMFQQLYHKGNEKKFVMTMELLTSIWSEEDFTWFVEYHNLFKKLTGHA